MKGRFMHWLREHLHPRPRDTLPPQEVREASHRLANEAHKVHAEAVRTAGGYHGYRRQAAETKKTIETLLGRIDDP